MTSDVGNWIAAARPTLFDTVAYPDVLVCLVLANLTSASTWEFRRSIEKRQASARSAGSPGDRDDVDSALVLEHAREYADRHLSHIAPLEVAEEWGIIELSDVGERIGQALLDRAMNSISEGVRGRAERGELQPNQNMLGLIAEGRFPEYDYSNIELVRAHRNLLGHKKHKPWGVTICADEAVLIASLACVLGQTPLSKFVIFGSPLHYAVLLEHWSGKILVNGKHQSYDQDAWHRAYPSGEAALAELDRLVPIDRLMGVAGSVDVGDSVVTMNPTNLASVDASFQQFLGARLPQLAEATAIKPTEMRHPPASAWGQLDACRSAAEARTRLRILAEQYPSSVLDRARYAAREIDVPDPTIYLDAALRGPRLRAAAGAVAEVSDAIGVLQSIGGYTSVLRIRDRIALPDEVLMFDTGDDVDRGLLLLGLLTAAGLSSAPRNAGSPPASWQLVITETGSFVGSHDYWIGITSLDSVAHPSGNVLCRLVPDRG